MDYEFEIKELEPVTVAAIHYKGKFTEAGKHFPTIYKAINGKSSGVPFFLYHNGDEQTKTGELELCVPTDEKPVADGITAKELPRVKVLYTTHVGSYDTLRSAYEALNSYAKEKGIKLGASWREIFIKGPGMLFRGNPKNYITEVAIPVVVMENE